MSHRAGNKHRSNLKVTLALFFSAAFSGALASYPETQTFHLAVANASDAGGAIPTAMDSAGNMYVEYAAPTNTIRLKKLAVDGSQLFDVLVTTLSKQLVGITPLTISTAKDGHVFVYAGWTTLDSNNNDLACTMKFDVNGKGQWPAEFSLSNVYGGDYLLGVDADVNANVYMCMADGSLTGPQLKIMRLGPDGKYQSQATCTNITPLASSGAFYAAASNTWCVGGADNDVPGYARWGSYSAANGACLFGGTFPNSSTTTVAVHVSRLPGFEVAVIHDVVTTGSAPTPSFDVTAYSFFGSAQWRYPTTGSEFGNMLSVTCQSATGSIYGTGTYPSGTATYDFIDQFSWSGVRNWRRNVVPADALIPTPEGFYSVYKVASTNTLYVEHANTAGTYDWARSYTNVSSPGAALVVSPNAFSVAMTVGGTQLTIDRFVSGVTLQSISAPASVTTPSSFTLTVQLNGVAPSGGTTVSLTSSDPHALFASTNKPSATVVVPAGQSSLAVAMTAQAVPANVTVKLTAVQNGVKASASLVLQDSSPGKGGPGKGK